MLSAVCCVLLCNLLCYFQASTVDIPESFVYSLGAEPLAISPTAVSTLGGDNVTISGTGFLTPLGPSKDA